MFDQIFERSDALRRQLTGPLREARLAYLHHRAEQGCGTQKFRMTSNSDRYERQTIRLSFIYASLSDRIRP